MSEHGTRISVEALTERELEVLRLLAAGLSNRAIAFQLSLTVNTVKVHLRNIFGKLDVTSRTAAIRRATEPTLLSPAPESSTALHSKHNLPEYITSFVGREKELHEIAASLKNPSCRLLTLYGLGGIGKTRLALQGAKEQIERFADGVFFVRLQAASTPHQIAIAIAEALKLSFYGHEEPRSQVLNFLRTKHLLLVLDSFEHLLPGADLVTEILQAAPDVKILITSREATGLAEEWLRPVLGLMTNSWDDTALTGDDGSALVLFAERARQVRAEFSFERDHVAVVRICQLVEGMPLAIELAAAWLTTLSCQDIADEIQHSLDVLTTTRRNVPERHQSIQAMFEQSLRLLIPQQRTIFTGFSRFRNGFTREAAHAVTGANLLDLTSFVNKALLRRNPETGRYEIHELLRQYAETNLDPAEHDRVCEAHSRYFTTFMAQCWDNLRSKRQKAALDEIEVEFENIRLTWHRLVAKHELKAIVTCANSLWLFADLRSRQYDVATLFRLAIDALRPLGGSEAIDLTLGPLLARTALLDASYSFTREAKQTAQEALALLRRWEAAPEEIIVALFSLYLTAIFADEREEFPPLARESVRLTRQLDNPWLLARAVSAVATTAMLLQNYEEAVRLSEEALALAQQTGDPFQIAYCTGLNLGWLNQFLGNYERAYSYYSKSLQLFGELGVLWAVADCHRGIADAATALQKYAEARHHYLQCLEICASHFQIGDILETLLHWAEWLARQGQYLRAFELTVLVRRYPSIGVTFPVDVERLCHQLRGNLSTDACAQAEGRAQLLDLDTVVKDILRNA
jgi:predicted ATPase/DNA-binding CsgD family transcriptional regulator